MLIYFTFTGCVVDLLQLENKVTKTVRAIKERIVFIVVKG
jgi:hypothetical protein